MKLEGLSTPVIVSIAIFFGLQLLPHHFTSLIVAFSYYFYILTAVALLGILVVGLLIFGTLWIFAKQPAQTFHRKWCLTLVTALLVAIAFTLTNFWMYRGLPGGSFAENFDSSTWKLDSSSTFQEDDITERQKMLGSAIREVISDKQRGEIMNAMGPSDGGPFVDACDLVYRLGPQRSGFPIDDEWLLIWFDNEGRVTRYDIWTD